MVQAAYVFWHQADYEGADAGFQRALESCTDYAPALVGRGRVALARGDAKRAVELLSKASAKNSDTETARASATHSRRPETQRARNGTRRKFSAKA